MPNLDTDYLPISNADSFCASLPWNATSAPLTFSLDYNILQSNPSISML